MVARLERAGSIALPLTQLRHRRGHTWPTGLKRKTFMTLQEQLRAGGWLPEPGPTYQEMLKQRTFALGKADAIVKAAESAGRDLTDTEALDFDTAMTAHKALDLK